MQGSKIRLSPSELSLFCNAEVILTKNSIIQKTVALLADVQEHLTSKGHFLCPVSTAKISRGENYEGLPYIVLDYPRIANGEDLFFIRTMFWWGNFFSSTLQLGGKYKLTSNAKIAAAYDSLSQQDYYVGVNEDPWQHHFEASNYNKLSDIDKDSFNAILQRQTQIKIAAKWPLSEWDLAANRIINSWQMLATLVA